MYFDREKYIVLESTQLYWQLADLALCLWGAHDEQAGWKMQYKIHHLRRFHRSLIHLYFQQLKLLYYNPESKVFAYQKENTLPIWHLKILWSLLSFLILQHKPASYYFHPLLKELTCDGVMEQKALVKQDRSNLIQKVTKNNIHDHPLICTLSKMDHHYAWLI